MNPVKIYRETANINGINIFYRDTKTDGPAILCLHGRYGRGETWMDFIFHYGNQYRIIAPDQRGHGFSDKPISKYTIEEMAEDMIALIDYLEVKPVILFGHSMGGTIAAHMAAEFPEYVKSVAIMDKSAAGPEEHNDVLLEQAVLFDPVTRNWPLPFSSLIEAQEFIRNDQTSELSYQYFMNSLIETKDGYNMMFSRQAVAANIYYYHCWYNLLPKIKCPAMLLKSRGNDCVTDEDFERMKSLLPGCLAYEMSDSDHNVHLSNKEEFYKYCESFLGMSI